MSYICICNKFNLLDRKIEDLSDVFPGAFLFVVRPHGGFGVIFAVLAVKRLRRCWMRQEILVIAPAAPNMVCPQAE